MLVNFAGGRLQTAAGCEQAAGGSQRQTTGGGQRQAGGGGRRQAAGDLRAAALAHNDQQRPEQLF
jgi:hypothetical protein